MTASRFVRAAHRWVSIAFTLAVVVNLVALWRQRQETWIGILALVPLLVLLVSGLYLFVLPYRGRRGGADATR